MASPYGTGGPIDTTRSLTGGGCEIRVDGDGDGRPLRHLPGTWSLEDAHRFAIRRGLKFEVRALERNGYLDLTAQAVDAVL